MADTKIIDIIDAASRPLLSLEFFPPKDSQGLDKLSQAAEQLRAVAPDFVTVTWGAGGSTRQRTLDVCALLRSIGFNPVMPHLTCVGASRSELKEIADKMYEQGYRNIMTLRGDPPRGDCEFKPHPQGLAQAADLVRLLKERHPDFCCGVAGYPETHAEAASRDEDILYLKEKLDAGGDFITTQLFYDNDAFFSYEKRCRDTGIEQPILPGLLPVVSLKQAMRITSMCKASFPAELKGRLEKAEQTPGGNEKPGVEWATRQIKELLRHGVRGVHLYVLNQAQAALAPPLLTCFERGVP